MGKIKKIKAERKQLKLEREDRTRRRKRIFLRSSLVFLGLLVISLAVFLGYKKYPNVFKFASNREEQSVTTTKPKKYDKAPEMTIDLTKKYLARFTTNKGTFEASLDPTLAPKTVNNFVFLARDNFYDNLVFHRIVKDFMIQGGDPNGDGSGGPGYKFDDEPITKDYKPGILAMANSGKNTNGSQFFIMAGDYSGGKLPKDYVIFGEIAEGMDTVFKIAETPVEQSSSGENSKPKEQITIEKVEIVES